MCSGATKAEASKNEVQVNDNSLINRIFICSGDPLRFGRYLLQHDLSV